MKDVIWSKRALRHAAQIHAYLDGLNPLAAQRFMSEIVVAGDSLAQFSGRGRFGLEPGTRELVAYWPYVLVYEVKGDTVQILAVWHGAQDR